MSRRQAREPIAIVGIGCRFPGASGPDAFWRFLSEGGDAIREVPRDRFDIDAWYDPRPGIPGKLNTRWGGFLDDVDRFDAAFFGISPREAARMDPQQRLLLEVAVEALEDAGIVAEELQGSPTGVFVGILGSDYCDRALSYPPGLDVYAAAGSELSVASGRISFVLGLQGPSASISAACASSLVSAHFACQSLWSGESTLALAGGTNLILNPAQSIPFAQAGMLAPDGRCKFCSARADGFVRSEGVGLVVLKPLARALADGDPVYAVILGSATNNDGNSGGLLMTPSQPGQERALREAYADAGISPGSVHYVEAHGTGTRAGDPVELGALAAVMGDGRPPGCPCRIGSVKSNIGHLEGAAGIAGLIKAALCLHHKAIPPTLHCEDPNPDIPWDQSPLLPQHEYTEWPYAGPARAGVSSAGINGDNAHLVLEEAPAQAAPAAAAPVSAPAHRAQVLTLSAQSPAALRELAASYRDLLLPAEEPPPALADVCYSASARRSPRDHSVCAVGETPEAVATRLGAWLDGEAVPGVVTGRVNSALASRPRIAFLFSGQGSQWVGMGRQLFAEEPVFRGMVEACHEAMRPYADWSLVDELHASEQTSRLSELGVIQPAIFAMQVGLAALLRSFGVEPDTLVGQSLGEVAAAYTGGALGLDDAARVICERSRLVDRTCGRGRGGMAVIGLPLEETGAEIARYGDALSIAVSSGPTSTIVSGDPGPLADLVASLEVRDVFASLIAVDYASHSAHMDAVHDDLLAALRGIRPRTPELAIYSTVTAQPLGDLPMDAGYWWRNLREPVLFSQVLEALLASEHGIFVEVSPHPVVASGIQQGLRHLEKEALVVPAMRRGEDPLEVLLTTLGGIHAAGGRVEWEKFHGGRRAFVALPRYPWQRERHWFPQDEDLRRYTQGAAPASGHPLLGARFSSAREPGARSWEVELGTDRFFWLNDHRVQDVAVFPAAAYLEMALAAATELFGPGTHVLEDVRFETALFLADGEPQRAQLCVTPGAAGRAHFQLFARDAAANGADVPWTLHASGTLCSGEGGGGPEDVADYAELRAACDEELDAAGHYAAMEARGLQYGPTFQGVQRIWRRDGEALGHIRLPEALASQTRSYRFHPALLDACLQVAEACMPRNDPRVSEGDAYLPVGVDRLELLAEPGPELWSRVRSDVEADSDLATLTGELEIRDAAGRLVVAAHGMRMQRVEGAGPESRHFEDWLYEMRWWPRELEAEGEAEAAPPAPPAPAAEGERWVILADASGSAEALREALEREGHACVMVYAGSGFERVAESRYRVDPLDPGDFHKLFGGVFGEEGARCRGVVHLWNLDTAPAEEIDAAGLARARASGCVSAVHVVQAGLDVSWARGARLWLVTRGVHPVGGDVDTLALAQAPIWGLGRVASHELPELRCTRIDLDPRAEPGDVEGLVRELRADDREEEIALRAGARYVYRLERHADVRTGALAGARRRVRVDAPFRLELQTVGLLDSMLFRSFRRREPGPGELEIRIEAAALNFRDLLLAMGVLPEEVRLGWECAGRVTAVGAGVEGFAVGDEVLAFVPGCFGSYTYAPSVCAVRKPANLSFEQGAALPLVFLTAVHCLETLARLQPGERVLIHSAAGGVGLAAIQIAKRIGAEIYVTAGSDEKRAFLRGLGVAHVMDSRSFEWVREVKERGGVDVVLNFLEGEAIQKGLSVLRPFGRFVEIGKKDLVANSRIGLEPFLNNLQFLVMEGVQLAELAPELFGQKLRELLPRFEDGTLEPLPVTPFPFAEAPEAFRFMAQAKHIGKLVLSFAGVSEMSVAPPAAPPLEVRADGTYLVTGGLGGLGLEVAKWLVSRGARHLALMGRSAPSDAAREKLAALEAAGAEVRVVAADVSVEAQVRDVLAELRRSMPPLRGIVQSALVLEDGILAQLDGRSFQRVMAPKVEGSWNLHRHTLEDALDFFVLFSSAASFLGSPGQGNYSAANAFEDSLAFYRRIHGLPALTINWGPWSEVGQAAAQANRGERLEQRGVSSIRPDQGVRILERLLGEDAPQVAAIPFDVVQWCEFYPAAADSPLLADLLGGGAGGGAGGGGAIAAEVAGAAPSERLAMVQDYLGGVLMRVLQLEGARIDPDQSLNRMGLDSLMAMELRNRVQADLRITLPIVKLLKGGTIAQLAKLVLELFEEGLEEPRAGAGGADEDTLLAEIESLPEEEVERMLAEEAEGGANETHG